MFQSSPCCSLGHPINSRKLFKIMEQYDQDASGQLEFNEFLMMFRDELLDLREIMDYIKLHPARGGEGPASSWPRSDRLVEVGCAGVGGVDQEQVRLAHHRKSRSCMAASCVLGISCGFGRQPLPGPSCALE